jgi:hypothetical protein
MVSFVTLRFESGVEGIIEATLAAVMENFSEGHHMIFDAQK